jgi:hypothetical protein
VGRAGSMRAAERLLRSALEDASGRNRTTTNRRTFINGVEFQEMASAQRGLRSAGPGGSVAKEKGEETDDG